MSLKKLSLPLILGFAFAGMLAMPSRVAAQRASGSISVLIRPEALVSAPATVTALPQLDAQSLGSSWLARFDLPVAVKIRLATGVAAELTIESAANPAEVIAGLTSGEITVNGSSAPFASGAPTRMNIGSSGMYQLPARITLRGAGGLASGALPVRIALRSLDGAIDWASTVQLAWSSLAP